MSYLLKPIGFFNTPESTEDLQNYIDLLTGNEKFVANVIMGKTWNLCAELTKQPESVGQKVPMDTAQMAMYLDRGLESEIRNDETHCSSDFNEWFCHGGDLERTQAVIELCETLFNSISDDSDLEWPTVCYIMLEERLSEYIYEQFFTGKDKDIKKIVDRFEYLLVEFTDLQNQQG